jgi:flagellar basal body-associated protein FliL
MPGGAAIYARPCPGMLSSNQTAALLMSLNALPLGLVAYHTAYPAPVTQSADAGDEGPTRPILKLDGVLVQLKMADARAKSRYLAIHLDLELDDESSRGEITQRVARLRDSILSYFSDRTAEQLEAAGALLKMKEDLRDRLNTFLPGPRILNVYVAQFIIQ